MNKDDYYTAAFEKAKGKFQLGDIYVDGFGHPTVCLIINIEDDDVCLEGVSLYDGSYPRGCSVVHTVPEKISHKEAFVMKEEYEKSKNSKCSKH